MGPVSGFPARSVLASRDERGVTEKSQALSGLRVLDLSRILAGPSCTQMLGDLGADIIKVEQPEAGDDTRRWGPPYLKDADGLDTTESAYYLSANRNKRSVAIDIATSEGQALIGALLEHCDVLIENFKVGSLKQYGLDYDSLKGRFPRLVYCSITGFGQTGPMAREPGYDFLAQALGGLMAITGEAEGEPVKAGVALSDVMTGLYAAVGILAALRHRDATGEGQQIDLSLLDVTVAGMVNVAQYYLTSGSLAPRLGNAHSTIVPYQVFPTLNGHIIVAVGNDAQFRRLCAGLKRDEWGHDARFATNSARVRNRETLVPLISGVLVNQPTDHWIRTLKALNVPAGPVNRMDQVFAMEQAQAREMEIALPHPLAPDPIHLVGSPLKLSATPVQYRAPPPAAGQHTKDVLRELLRMDDSAIQSLKDKKAIEF
jgi:crotonobetainyl-CoA:carnitine CoA-transferase CaiB-like acyl-CoA transferase